MNLILAFSILIALYLLVIWKAGKTYPILYLFIFIYFLQYIFSPYLSYTEYKVLGDQMPISKQEYFGYAIPAVLSLTLGVLLFAKNIDVRRVLGRIDPVQAGRYGYILIAISYGLDFVSFIGLSGLNSVISFI